MRIEIFCAHPFAKRGYYGPGWICERERGGCGASGSGEEGHYTSTIGYFEIPDEILNLKQEPKP
jgi:hypothetical protein